MEESTTTTQAPDPPVAANELVRPIEGRVLGGVSQGLANRYNLPVWLVRVAFVVFSFVGGLAVATYAAGWFLIRSEDESETPVERVFSGPSSTRSRIGIGLVLLAALTLFDNFTFLSPGVVWVVGLLVIGVLLHTGNRPGLMKRKDDDEEVEEITTHETQPRVTETDTATTGDPTGGGIPPIPTPTRPILPPAANQPKETFYLGRLTIGAIILGVGVLALLDATPGVEIYPKPRHYLALSVTILGVGLLVGTIWGRARWLLIIAVVLIPTLLFSPIFEWDWTTDTIEQTVIVSEFEDLEDLYALDFGNMVIDLRQLPWDNENIQLAARIDLGNLEVLIPSDISVTGTASADIGRVAGLGQDSAGIGSPNIVFDREGPNGSVDLDLQVDIGNVNVNG